MSEGEGKRTLVRKGLLQLMQLCRAHVVRMASCYGPHWQEWDSIPERAATVTFMTLPLLAVHDQQLRGFHANVAKLAIMQQEPLRKLHQRVERLEAVSKKRREGRAGTPEERKARRKQQQGKAGRAA